MAAPDAVDLVAQNLGLWAGLPVGMRQTLAVSLTAAAMGVYSTTRPHPARAAGLAAALASGLGLVFGFTWQLTVAWAVGLGIVGVLPRLLSAPARRSTIRRVRFTLVWENWPPYGANWYPWVTDADAPNEPILVKLHNAGDIGFFARALGWDGTSDIMAFLRSKEGPTIYTIDTAPTPANPDPRGGRR